MLIKEIDKRKFLVLFASRKDMLQVLDMEPWTYMDRLVLISEVQLGRDARDVDGSMMSFWVQMHGIPLLNMTMVVAQKIGALLGQMLTVDHIEDKKCIGRFVQVHIHLGVRHPLMQGYVY